MALGDGEDDLASRFVAAARIDGLANPQVQQAFSGLAEFAAPFLHTWSHLHLSVIAYRLPQGWLAQAVLVTLSDDAGSPEQPLDLEDVAAGRCALPIDELPALLHDAASGVLSAARNPFGRDLRMCNSPGEAYRQGYGTQHSASWPAMFRENAFCRFTLELRSERGLDAWFADSRAAEQMHRRFLRAIEGTGVGTIESLAEVLGFPKNLSQSWNSHSTFTLSAPLPLTFGKFTQTIDRTRLRLELQRGPHVRRDAIGFFMAPQAPAILPTRLVVGDNDVVELTAPQNEQVLFTLTYCGQPVARRPHAVYPRLRRNPRQVAFAAFERLELIANGLAGKEKRQERDSDAFERSVAHILGMLGWSTFWWGPHKGGPTVPEEQADLLAWSADDAVVLVLDCTLRPESDLKSVKLVSRAREIERALRDRGGHPCPRVAPVLAVGVPRAQVARILRRTADDDEVCIVAVDELEGALEGLRQGLSHAEVVSGLPEVLRMGLRALRGYELPINGYY